MNKKRMVCLLLCLAMCLSPITAWAADDVIIDAARFPDTVFRTYVQTEFDTDKDGVLSPEEIENARVVDLAGSRAADLTGLELFTSLTELDVSQTGVKTLRLIKNLALEKLNVSECSLTALDVSKNTALTELDCSGCQVTGLNLARNTALEKLNVNGCPIKMLDVSKCPALTELDCGGTPVTTLNLNRNAALETLRLSGCAMKLLDVTKNPALKTLDCSKAGLTKLDVKANPTLETLICAENELTELDLSASEALRTLDCSDNHLTALDVTVCPALESLMCGRNLVEALDLSGNGALKTLVCSDNLLRALDLAGTPDLLELDCARNLIKDLNLKAVPYLETLDCSSNAIGALNLGTNSYLRVLECRGNYLTKVDLSGNSQLERVNCWGNDIHALSIENNSMLLKAFDSGLIHKTAENTIYSLAAGDDLYEIAIDPETVLQDGSVAPPTITAQPVDARVKNGEEVTIKVNAKGSGLIYRWYYKEAKGDRWLRLTGANNAKLTITGKKGLNGRKYRCEVLNRGGMAVSSSAKLTVISKPAITTQPGNKAALAGKKVSFSVAAEGGELTYQWYYLPDGASEWIKIDDGTSSKLTVTVKEELNATKYRCVVSNEAGKVTSDEAKLTVIRQPVITQQPQDATVAKNKKATFAVAATGGRLKYQWYVKKTGSEKWKAIKGATEKTLTFKGTNKNNGNQYRCKVYNDAGQVYTIDVTLYVTL